MGGGDQYALCQCYIVIAFLTGWRKSNQRSTTLLLARGSSPLNTQHCASIFKSRDRGGNGKPTLWNHPMVRWEMGEQIWPFTNTAIQIWLNYLQIGSVFSDHMTRCPKARTFWCKSTWKRLAYAWIACRRHASPCILFTPIVISWCEYNIHDIAYLSHPDDWIHLLLQPFLLDGFKCDLRVYVLVTSCSPLRVFIYKDGLVSLHSFLDNLQ